MTVLRPTSAIMNSATDGLLLARRVMTEIEHPDPVQLDLQAVDRMTPSFANAFMMTLLNQLDRETLKRQLQVSNAKPWVAEAINASIRRFEAGIRLSTQVA